MSATSVYIIYNTVFPEIEDIHQRSTKHTYKTEDRVTRIPPHKKATLLKESDS
jgi:hypothetical protein